MGIIPKPIDPVAVLESEIWAIDTVAGLDAKRAQLNADTRAGKLKLDRWNKNRIKVAIMKTRDRINTQEG